MAKTTNKMNNKDGFPILGWLVNYSTERGYTIDRADLQAAMSKVGMDPGYACSIHPKNAAIRAVREVAKSNKGRFHKKVADQDSAAAFVIANIGVDEQNFDANFKQETKGVLDKATKQLKVTGANKDDVEGLFKKRLDQYASDQFRSIILRYLKRECNAITYLETGNIYFVPVSMKAKLDKLRELFMELGSYTRLVTKEEIDTRSIRSVMWDVTVGELKNELASLEKDFGQVDEVTSRSLDIRLKRYTQLKTKCEMFEEVLSGTASDIKDKLDKLTSLIRKKVIE